MNKLGIFMFTLVVLAAGLLIGYLVADFKTGQSADVVPAEPTVDENGPAVDSGPVHPVTPVDTEGSGDRQLVELPPLDDSDAYFELALLDVFGAAIEQALVSQGLIDRFVATVDNLPRAHVAEKIRPVGRLAESFAVAPTGNDGEYLLLPENYARYDGIVSLFESADTADVVATYRRFYPLFQESYERLGYPNAYFNDRVVEVIDHLLATPRPDEPLMLVRPHVLYTFADADLEALSSGQKLLLRIGPKNREIVMQRLSEFRSMIASEENSRSQ